MTAEKLRALCPGYFYAEAITDALIRDVKSVPLAERERREAKLQLALDYGRTLLQVAEPLARKAGFPGIYESLYNRIQDMARPWCDDGKEQFIEGTKTELCLEVLYEVQREIRERLPLKNGKRVFVVDAEGRAA